MTALTSLLLTSPVPLGSAGEVIWLPTNLEAQVVSGRFVSVETDSRDWGQEPGFAVKTSQEALKSLVLLCSTPTLSSLQGCEL